MADSHLQVNHNGSLENRKTVLWGTSEAEKREVLLQIFSQPNWRIDTLEHIEGSYWKLETSSQNISYKINLYVSSVRDEARQPDEYKMQLGAISPIVEEGWITLIMGIYTISHGPVPNEYILSAYNKDRFTFSTNPSIRGTRTSGLQKAKILGFYKTDISYLFRPEFIYYYIGNQEELNNKATEDVIKNEARKTSELPQSLQVIYYGAPGTGKSHTVKRHTEGESVVRTTFHPDSDYSTFVGCYKPTTKEIEMRDVTGKVIVEHGQPVTENRIIYQFVEQAFLQAYIKSWKFYAEAEDDAAPKKQFLIIEEINRGNCAQIFGDLFQLLDRNDSGFSEYFIHADKDMQKHISNAFKDCLIKESHKDTINSLYPKDDDVVAKVLSGEILLLPNNLYIWATMNTSDQSLFPIDSAFKRRWDWEYEPIKYKNTNWVIDINGNKYSWVSFQHKINDKILEATSSEDKMLGDYFVNPADGVITEKILLNKILFYLWNDVCKDGEGDIFKISETTDICFSDLHGEGGSEKLVSMMKYLGVSLANNTIEENLDIEQLDQESKTWYLNLWTDIRKSLENNGQQNLPNARDRQTYQLSVGLTGISVLANISKTKANGFVCYYVEKQQANDIYPKLLNLKDTIENSLGELEWHREDNKYGIAKRNIELTSINDSSTRNELIEQISKLLIDFKATIIPLVDQLR